MTTSAPSSRRVMTRQEVADAAGVSVATIDRAVRLGQLPALRIGPGKRLVRIWPEDVDRWLNHSEEEHDDAA
jgi:excisionase family DNA binding protein